MLPPLQVHYADYALWQQEWLQTPQFQKQLGYWAETLDGDPPVLDMPTDYPREMGPAYTAFIESLLLPQRLGDDLRRLCLELDVTLFMVLFGTYIASAPSLHGPDRIHDLHHGGQSQRGWSWCTSSACSRIR